MQKLSFGLLLIMAHLMLANAAFADGLQSPAILKSELIFDNPTFPSCHASTIVETPKGLVAAWFGGTKEKHRDVGIWVSRLVDGKWTAPKEVANGAEKQKVDYPCWNPVLFQPKTGPLMLFYKVGPNPDAWWGMLMTSTDSGETWSETEFLPKGILGPIKNKPVQLSNGDILSGTSTEEDGWRVYFERSRDLGKTWTATKLLNDGHQLGAIQPSILIHSDGVIQSIGRTKQGRVFQIWSQDEGQTWGEMTLTDLPNPNSGTDAVTLKDGRHLLVYNHTPKHRSPLNVAVSQDGRAWQAALVLENTEGEFSYPAIIQTADGLVHVTYTWKRDRIKHVVLDPQKLTGKPFENGAWPKP
jgi:predicted neuraminidase